MTEQIDWQARAEQAEARLEMVWANLLGLEIRRSREDSTKSFLSLEAAIRKDLLDHHFGGYYPRTMAMLLFRDHHVLIDNLVEALRTMCERLGPGNDSLKKYAALLIQKVAERLGEKPRFVRINLVGGSDD